MKVQEEKLYLIISLIFGMIMVFIIPPFQSPDEDSHFKKTYLVSTGEFYPIEENGVMGNYLPNNLIDYIAEKNSYMSALNKKFNYQSFLIDLHTYKLSDEKTFHSYSTSSVNPVIYSIPAIGIIISKIISFTLNIDSSITSMLYGARLLSLLVYTFITYYAIKTTPKFKKTLLVFTLMPMTLALYSCVTYDSLLISISALLFSMVMKYRFGEKEKVCKKDLILFSIIAFIYLNVKTIYIFNLLFLLLIPFKKWGKSKKDFFLKAGVCSLAIIICYFIFKYPLMKLHVNAPSNNLSSEQINFIIHNPFKYIRIYLNTLVGGRFFLISTFVGVFGLLDSYLPYPIVFMYILFIIMTMVVDSNDSIFRKKLLFKERAIGLIIPLLTISLAFLGMYIYWTSQIDGYGVGAESITGVQGRYFIPSIIFIVLLFVNGIKSNWFIKLKNIYNNNYYYMYIFTSIISIFIILLRFWI